MRRAGSPRMANPGLQQCRTALRCKFFPHRPWVERMRSTGGQGCDTCVARAYRGPTHALDGWPWVRHICRTGVHGCTPRACAKHAVRSAMDLPRPGKQMPLHPGPNSAQIRWSRSVRQRTDDKSDTEDRARVGTHCTDMRPQGNSPREMVWSSSNQEVRDHE